MNDEQNKIAVVTGASRGIGKEIALALGNTLTVIGTATTDASAENISSYLKESGIAGKGYCLDVASEESIEEFVKAAQGEFGAIGVLVNNAGITRDNILMRMKADEWDQVINTNLSSIYRMSKALVRGMTKVRWGRIISISSVVGSSGNIGQANYAAAKAGLEGFSRALAMEIGSRGITVNAVAPGFIDTDMTKGLDQDQAATLMSKIPLGRYGNPEEIAAVVAFLASEQAGYITGETIHVNGGMYMG